MRLRDLTFLSPIMCSGKLIRVGRGNHRRWEFSPFPEPRLGYFIGRRDLTDGYSIRTKANGVPHYVPTAHWACALVAFDKKSDPVFVPRDKIWLPGGDPP